MASNISTTSLDITFPVAGQDNDSQGFRDNYNIIKTNFDYAKTEIETLMTNTAKLNEENVFNGTLISDAVLSGTAELYFDAGVTDGSEETELSYSNGQYQSLVLANNTTLLLSNWTPNIDRYSRIRVEITGTEGNVTEYTATWASANGGTIKYANGADTVVVTDNAITQIFEFWTYDAGQTVFGNKVGSFV